MDSPNNAVIAWCFSQLRATGALFARKFGSTNAPPKTWQRLVLGDNVSRPRLRHSSSSTSESEDNAASKRKRGDSEGAPEEKLSDIAEQKRPDGQTEEGEEGDGEPQPIPAHSDAGGADRATQPHKLPRTT